MQGRRADEAASAIFLDLLATIEATVPGAIAGDDPDQLHDLRVAVRQTRTVAHAFAGVFPPGTADLYLDEFKWLQRLTNPTRDLDVLLLELEKAPERFAPGLTPVKKALGKRRTAERTKLRRGLRSARLKTLLTEWRASIEALSTLDPAERPDAERPAKKVAGEQIAKRYKKVVKLGKATKRDSSPELIHELRKRAKDLRYLLNFFADLYPKWAVKPLRKDLKNLHAVLGGFQDRVVQEQVLREVADDLTASGNNADPLLAIGAVLDEMRRDQIDADKEFAKAFAKFSAKKRRAIVKSEIH